MKSIIILIGIWLGSMGELWAQYQVGSIYNQDGVTGIVVKVTDDGRHGLVMSLTSSKDKWLKDKDAQFSTGAFDEEDGEKNMEAIAKYIAENGKTWEDFPLFAWCRSLGAGWYIPARDEVEAIRIALNGNTDEYDKSKVEAFNKLIKKAKGTSLYDDGMAGTKNFRYIMSSTETEGGTVYMLCFQQSAGSIAKTAFVGGRATKGKFTVIPFSKTVKAFKMLGTRAVHKF